MPKRKPIGGIVLRKSRLRKKALSAHCNSNEIKSLQIWLYAMQGAAITVARKLYEIPKLDLDKSSYWS